MSTLITDLFSIVNAPLTIFMIAMLVYWLFTMFGIFDMSNFDVDIDLDADLDMDLDTDIDDFSGARAQDVQGEAKRPRKLSAWQIFLVFFHFAEVPFMMAFTLLILVWWVLTVVFTNWFGLTHSVFGYVIMAATLVPALFIMKIITYPLKGLMNKLNPKGVEKLVLEGRIAQTSTKITDEKMGQLQLIVDESPIKVYAKCLNKNQVINENTEVLIIKKSADSKYYLIDLNH